MASARLLRGDPSSRVTAATGQYSSGMITKNEARVDLGRNPVEGGDVFMQPLNQAPIQSGAIIPANPKDVANQEDMPADDATDDSSSRSGASGVAHRPFDRGNDSHDEKGRFAHKGFNGGPVNVDLIIRCLGITHQTGDAVASPLIHKKISGKSDYKTIRKTISKCLSAPDLIGTHKRHPGKIVFIKMTPGMSGNFSAVLVSVGMQLKNGQYGIASAYPITAHSISTWMSHGTLKAAK